MWSVDWDHAFVVGGDGNRRLTPSFRLKEFRRPDGDVRVHRELVSALQLLRDRYGKPVTVQRTDSDGLGTVVSAASVDELLTSATAARDRRLFDQVDRQADGVHVRIEAAGSRPPIDLAEALETAFSVTSAFETAGDKFQQVTGNFDGAGMSFGPAQVNFGSGTLVPLFRAFVAADEPALHACFTDEDDYDDWRRVMDLPVVDQQVEWANAITTGRGRHDIIEPWKGYFQAVGRVKTFREIMVTMILRDYGGRMARAIRALQGLRPDIQIDHLRCMCSLYDLVVQQGSLDKAWDAIKQRVQRENPQDQFALTHIAVEERGRRAAQLWQADAISRRLGILKGVPETVDDRQRANINFYMLRDVHVAGAAELWAGDPTAQFVSVSQAVASGRTLLA
jgi:hypothetical protein